MLLILLCLVSFGYVFTIYSSVLLLPSILQKYVLVFMSLINNLWLDFNFLSESISERFCSVTKSCLTLCDHMDCSMPGLPVHRYLLEFAQVNVHLRISGFNSLKFIVITGKVELCYTIFNIFGHVLFFSFSIFIRIYWGFCCCCFLTASSLSFGVQDICCNMWGSLVAVHRLSSCDSRSCHIQISLLCSM